MEDPILISSSDEEDGDDRRGDYGWRAYLDGSSTSFSAAARKLPLSRAGSSSFLSRMRPPATSLGTPNGAMKLHSANMLKNHVNSLHSRGLNNNHVMHVHKGVIRPPAHQQSLLHGRSSSPFNYSANPIRAPRHMIATSLLDMEFLKKRREIHQEKSRMTGRLPNDIKQEGHRESHRPSQPKERPEAALQERPTPPHFEEKQEEAAPQQRSEEDDERIIFKAALKDLNQPTGEIDPPEGVLSVPLFRHQKMALAWMVEKEKGEGVCAGGILADDQGLGKTISMIALIQMQRSLQEEHKAGMSALEDDKDEKLASSLAKMEPRVEYDGDTEGVSKRIRLTNNWKPETVKSVVNSEALMMDNDNKGKKAPSVGPVVLEPKAQYCKVNEILRKMGSGHEPAAGTLVVCPASVLRQWARELDEKVTKESKLSVLVYHGSKRTTDPVVLAKYDVVLTTYSLVEMEVPKQPLVGKGGNKEENYKSSSITKKRKKTLGNETGKKVKAKKGRSSDDSCGTLAKVRWFRVILDEAHIIKNHTTKVARACCSLRTKSSWCLSGTPVQNEIEELYSYFRFLRHKLYSNYSLFEARVKRRVTTGSEHDYKRIRCVLKTIMLRRTKATLIDGKPLLVLPPKTIHLSKVDFSDDERDFYDALERKYTNRFLEFAARGTILNNYAIILVMILRLRQACDHRILVIRGSRRGQESLAIAKNLPPEKLLSLLGALENYLAICSVCGDLPEDEVVTICGHVCCCKCGRDYFAEKATTCPEDGCEEEMNADALFTEEILRMSLSNDSDRDSSNSFGNNEELTAMKNGSSSSSSSKIKAAVQILQSYCKPQINELKPAKAIVFSQWTGMLDLVEDKLRETNLEFRRLDGSMSLLDRDKAVKDFNTRPEVTVMIMSLKAGNLGLNMVAACHVILLDPWWNPTTEDQAIDRAHRIGQTRPVTVTRLTIANTIEDRILDLQERKRKMVSDVLGEDQIGGAASRLTVEDLKSLFNVR